MLSLPEYEPRRSFIRNILFATAGMYACKKSIPEPDYDHSEQILSTRFTGKIALKSKYRILFIGDSITDANRDKSDLAPNSAPGLGEGYVREIKNNLINSGPFGDFFIYNRGISGDKTIDLLYRWNTDAISLAPQIISILIGVNDLRGEVTPTTYYRIYRKILQRTKERLPATKVILCEPFILNNMSQYAKFEPAFHEYRKVIRTLATEFKTIFVPFYDILYAESQNNPVASLLKDGFHPTPLAITALKKSWLEILS